MNDYEERENDAKFNMAIATLRRIDNILQHLAHLPLRYVYDTPEKQKAHSDLVKSLYVLSSPLFGQTGDEKKLLDLKDEVLSFGLESKSDVKKGVKLSYSRVKEKRLLEITMEIQTALKKFFMPRAGEDDDEY